MLPKISRVFDLDILRRPTSHVPIFLFRVRSVDVLSVLLNRDKDNKEDDLGDAIYDSTGFLCSGVRFKHACIACVLLLLHTAGTPQFVRRAFSSFHLTVSPPSL